LRRDELLAYARQVVDIQVQLERDRGGRYVSRVHWRDREIS
jgi:hypothetical protein